MLALVGDAGIGKTRTVEEFVRRVDLPAGRVLWGRCQEQPGAPTYWPWVRAIRDYTAAHDADTVREHMAGGVPALPAIVPPPGGRGPPPDPPPASHPDPP